MHFLAGARKSDIVERVTDRFPSTFLVNGRNSGRRKYYHLRKEQTHMLAIHVYPKIAVSHIGSSIDVTPLHVAAADGATAIVRAIIEKFPDTINVKASSHKYKDGYAHVTPLLLAILGGHKSTYKYLIESGASLKDCIHMAVTMNDKSLVKTILDKGVSVNEKDSAIGRSPLHFAKNPSILSYLLNTPGVNIDIRDEYGYTPIMEFSRKHFEGRYECIRLLLQKGASLKYKGKDRFTMDTRMNSRNNGQSILHIIASDFFQNYKHVLRNHDDYILKSKRILDLVSSEYDRLGLNVNIKSSNGDTPVLYFVELWMRMDWNVIHPQHFKTFVSVLEGWIRNGANPNIRNKDGKNVPDLLLERAELGFKIAHKPYNLLKLMNKGTLIELSTEMQNLGKTLKGETDNKKQQIKNIHIPNNLNKVDPVLMNNVKLNDAYILKSDLLKKTITNEKTGKKTKVKEVKTVYNKSSLNGILKSGRSIVSPVTRKPFTADDILMLKTVAPIKELEKYKNKNNNNNSTNTRTPRTSGRK